MRIRTGFRGNVFIGKKGNHKKKRSRLKSKEENKNPGNGIFTEILAMYAEKSLLFSTFPEKNILRD